MISIALVTPALVDLLALDDLDRQRALALDPLDVRARDLDPDVGGRATVSCTSARDDDAARRARTGKRIWFAFMR